MTISCAAPRENLANALKDHGVSIFEAGGDITNGYFA